MSDEELINKLAALIEAPLTADEARESGAADSSAAHIKARRILAALAGRLLPEGTEQREEWRAYWPPKDADDEALVSMRYESREAAEQHAEQVVHGTRGIVQRRGVYTSAWRPVDE